MCVGVFPACISLCSMCRSGPWRAGKGIGSFETGGTDGYYLPCWDWELKPDLLLEGHMLLMVELLVYESVFLHVHLPRLCVWCSWRLEEGIRFLGLELQAVVSRRVGAGNQTSSSVRGAIVLNH